MKKYLKNYLTGIFVGLGFLSVLFLGYIIIKARQSTNPGIADDGQGMYATAGNTLTAGKWNSLVQRSTWVDVPTTDTANFDINCERRAINSVNSYCTTNANLRYFTIVVGNYEKLGLMRNGNTYIINSAEKNKMYYSSYSCNISLLQKRCTN